jgi:toxin FitB
MILLDTNVLSEPLRPAPEARVLAWLNAQGIETLYVSTITVAELRFGIAAMPTGKRKTILSGRFESEVLPLFSDRILVFDLEAASAYAALMARARQLGESISTADGYIAATAMAKEFAVATRDESPFRAAGLKVINPWDTEMK